MNELVFFFNTVLVSGVVLGSIYAIGAIGITLIFGILRFAHFAHGDMMTMGAFVSFVLAAALSAAAATPRPVGALAEGTPAEGTPAAAPTRAAAKGAVRAVVAPTAAAAPRRRVDPHPRVLAPPAKVGSMKAIAATAS